jgi:hypothetical protein
MKSPMSSKQIQPNAASNAVDLGLPFVRAELPLTLQQAAIYLGVSLQTVYLWVEKQNEGFRKKPSDSQVYGSGLESVEQLCRGVAQPGSAPALGAGGPRFKSARPDQFLFS